MKTEVIKYVSFDEQNERLFYTPLENEQEELSRRDALKFLTIGTTGLLVPMGLSKDAEALWWWIPGIVRVVAMVAAGGAVKYAFNRYEDKTARAKIANTEKKKAIQGNYRIELAKQEEDFKYIHVGSVDNKIEIPPKTTAYVSSEISSANDYGKYRVTAKAKDSSKSKEFQVT